MEQLNRIELRGIVGAVRVQEFAETKVARFTVATNCAYKDRNGAAVIETSWHNVVARSTSPAVDIESIKKGARVYVKGRLRYQKYVGDDGIDRYSTDVVAQTVTVLEDGICLPYETA